MLSNGIGRGWDLSNCTVCVFVCCDFCDAASNYALTSSKASMQFHSCGEEDILIGPFYALNPQSSQLGAQNIALGGEGQGTQQVGSITGLSPVSPEQLVAFSVGSSMERMVCCSFTGNVHFVRHISSEVLKVTNVLPSWKSWSRYSS